MIRLIVILLAFLPPYSFSEIVESKRNYIVDGIESYPYTGYIQVSDATVLHIGKDYTTYRLTADVIEVFSGDLPKIICYVLHGETPFDPSNHIGKNYIASFVEKDECYVTDYGTVLPLNHSEYLSLKRFIESKAK